MAINTNATAGRIVSLVLGTFLIIILIGLTIFMLAVTAGNIWIVYAVAAFIGVATGSFAWRAWRYLTGNDGFYVNFICHTLFSTLLLSTAALAVNYFAANPANMHRQEGVITRVYWEERHRTQRVSRRVYRRGPAYKAYVIELQLPDGTTRNFDVDKRKYDRAEKGDTATVMTGRGLLGFPIVNNSTIRLKSPRPVKNDRKCKFFGTSGGSKEVPDWVKKHHDVRPALDPDSVN